MSDITTVPFDYIVKHTKTENIVSQDAHGDYVCDIETEYIPLVRCKECKHYKQSESFCENGNGLWQAGDECFCSYGEREDE